LAQRFLGTTGKTAQQVTPPNVFGFHTELVLPRKSQRRHHDRHQIARISSFGF
jgi:hypothetical protein